MAGRPARRGHPPSKIDEAALVREYVAGASIRELERKHHTSWYRTKRLLLAHGVTIRPGRRVKALPDYPDDPHKRLALAIIAAACDDWDHNCFPSCCHWEHRPRPGLRRYFASQAFRDDCALAEIEPEFVLKVHGVELVDRWGEKRYNGDRQAGPDGGIVS